MKRILIVNANSVYVNNATGITVRSILNTYDNNRIMEIFWNDTELQEPNINSVKLPATRFSLRKIRKKKVLENINHRIKQDNVQADGQQRKKVIKKIRQFVSLMSDVSGVRVTKKIFETINQFDPDVIYTLGGGVNSLKLSYKLSKRLNIPIVIHYLDNWLHYIQWEDNGLLYFYKKMLRRYARLCQTRSSTGITISPKMAEAYTKELDIKHASIMNSVDVRSFMCVSKKENDSFKFIYAGGIHLGREQALACVADTIERIATCKGKNFSFDIYTSDSDMTLYEKQFKKFKCTHFKKYVPHDKIMEIYERADALVHVENASGTSDFFKYSISTKISEYLSTGKPVIFYGPKNIYLYEFLEDNNIALVASTVESLERQIKKLIFDYDSTKIITENAKKYALDNFDISVAQARFKLVVEQAKI